MVGSQVRFDHQGDGLGRYNIYNYQKTMSSSSSLPSSSAPEYVDMNSSILNSPSSITMKRSGPSGSAERSAKLTSAPAPKTSSSSSSSSSSKSGSYQYAKVGVWFDDGLTLDKSLILFNERSVIAPESVCSHPCPLGQIKILQQGDHCCWICNACKDQEYVVDEFTCAKCDDGWWPHDDKSGCHKLAENYMQWDSIYAIIPSVTSLLGMSLTAFVIRTLVKHNDTPIVKASGRELSFILLGGLMFCFLMTFVLLAKPSIITCSAQRFGVGTGFAVIYAALLTKTNRISRIFDSARISAKRPSFISPNSQVIICMVLVSVQVFGTIVWLMLEPPATRHWFPDPNRKSQVVLKCKVKDASFLSSLLYDIILVTTCTIYAIKTRKIPENFNESKFIGFTMYTTCIIWLAFIPLYFGTVNNYEIQITTLCVSISLSAYVALFCLFLPKIYIIIFHPDKNVRKLTMNSATYKRALTSSTLATAATNHGSAEAVKLMVTGSLAPATPAVTTLAMTTMRQQSTDSQQSKDETSNLLKPPTSLPLKSLNQPLDPKDHHSLKYSSTAPVSTSSHSKVEVTIYHEKPKDEIELAKQRSKSTTTNVPKISPTAAATTTRSSKQGKQQQQQHHHDTHKSSNPSTDHSPSRQSQFTSAGDKHQRKVTICDHHVLEHQDQEDEPVAVKELLETKKIQSGNRKKGKSVNMRATTSSPTPSSHSITGANGNGSGNACDSGSDKRIGTTASASTNDPVTGEAPVTKNTNATSNADQDDNDDDDDDENADSGSRMRQGSDEYEMDYSYL